ncbi:hypothetical protein D4764_0229500 [Takifugu flavidus]|uniref:Reverse transcriptase domain-containing protein n=1 Tax=Takifugu flavidus TaxID=433684 RepID=A0A5C6MNA9_9TELE|nr:hypothetical protein D4764_0229500 [Takifugu flavidus]
MYAFKPQNHTVELADGTRTNGAALRRGNAEVTLVDREGKRMKATLKKARYVPTYPQDIFSVKAATTNGASVNFREGHSELIHKSGTSCAEKRIGIVYTQDQLMALRPPSFVVGEKPQIPKEREYREASIMCFTETWLHGLIPDSNVTIAGSPLCERPETPPRLERVCSPHVELIAIGLRPYYLPREFTNVIAITVYIPPTGKADSACDVIHSVTADLQTKHPGAFILITGKSDHNLVLLSPSYTPVVQQQPVTFCTENSVPTKKVRCYPNNKPWVTSDLKALLNKKKRAFTAGDPAELRRAQKELKRSLKESKDAYRKKLEERLERNQTRDVWSGMRTITGFQKKGIRSADGNVDQANELNQFFNRTILHVWPGEERAGEAQPEKGCRTGRHQPTSAENCPRQLCGILQHLFNQSLHLQRIPVLWKTSCLVPVPKKTHPVAPSDYRPIALTSHIMKVMEQLVLSHLRPLVSPQDPLQFAYQPKVGVDDAVIYLLQRAYSSLDRLNTTVRVMFFDFSSAFNTIQPRLLRAKLEKMQMDAPLVSWIEDDLTGRPQFVRLRSCVSDPLMSNTGAPQGTVLSPFLFTTYTADFQYHSETCHLQKYSDDTVIVGCVENGQEDEYRDLVESFVRWSRENLLQLNVTKTKEMVVDFRKASSWVFQLDNKLEWSTNTDAVYKKAMSRLYFLRRLRMLQMFYQSVMASTIFFAAVCWGTGIKAKDANRLNRSVVGCRLDNVDEVVRDRMVLKLWTIMDSPPPPPPIHSRLLQPRCSEERYRKSFLPSTIRLYTETPPLEAHEAEEVTVRGHRWYRHKDQPDPDRPEAPHQGTEPPNPPGQSCPRDSTPSGRPETSPSLAGPHEETP